MHSVGETLDKARNCTHCWYNILEGNLSVPNRTTMYGCESWTVEKADGEKMNSLEIQCWRRAL